jgi:predicted NBD/HSP70 family sugar kinase
VEAWLSGPALAADHALAGGGALNAEQVVAAMRAGDAVAAASFERYARRLALALAGIVNVLDPQVIVLGGGLARCPSCSSACLRCGGRTSSATASAPRCVRRGTAIRRACRARPGWRVQAIERVCETGRPPGPVGVQDMRRCRFMRGLHRARTVAGTIRLRHAGLIAEVSP